MTDWATWQPRVRANLLFIVREEKILLIHKKRGFGAGKINGPGGKIDPGETPLQSAVRETFEELGINAARGRSTRRIAFSIPRRPQPALHRFSRA